MSPLAEAYRSLTNTERRNLDDLVLEVADAPAPHWNIRTLYNSGGTTNLVAMKDRNGNIHVVVSRDAIQMVFGKKRAQ